MKSILLTGIFLLGTGATQVRPPLTSPTLPELHKITRITLGCRNRGVTEGYGKAALFLSEARRTLNSPDLLFNGACGSPDAPQPDFLTVNTAGDDLSVIADVGEVALEELRAEQVFNVKRIHSPELYSRFTGEAQIKAGHTYAVLINKQGERGFFYFTIIGYVANLSLDLKYVVKDFQLTQVLQQSPGFDWIKASD